MSENLYGLTHDLVMLLDSDDEDAYVVIEEKLPVFETKAAAVAGFVVYGEDRAKMLRQRAAMFTEAARVAEARADRARSYLKECMEAVGATRIEDKRTGTVLAIQANGGRLPVVIEDEQMVRDLGYVKEPEPPPIDKAAVYSALSTGIEVPGARLGERGTHLVIR